MKLAGTSSLPTRTAYLLVTAGLLVAATGSCATTVQDEPVRQGPDISKLDVGNYQTEPRAVGNATTDKQARIRESQRLSDYVALPFEADATYTEEVFRWLRPHVVLNGKGMGDLLLNDTFDEVAKDLVAGWVNAWSTGGVPSAPRRTLDIAVLEFPDAEIAADVGPRLEHDDSTYNRDNVAVRLPNHPDAKAHWRPTISAVQSWTVHDRYVVFIKVVDDTSTPDLAALTRHTERMLDVQVPLLDRFVPTPADQLKDIPLDPDGLLGRTLPTNPEFQLRPDPDGVYTGRGSLNGMSSVKSLDFLKTGDLDLISFGDAAVFRSRTEKASRDLWHAWQPSTHPDPKKKMVKPPTGLGDNIECWKGFDVKIDNGIEYCLLQVDRYVVQSAAKQSQDLRQKTSAQYALLTSR